MKSTFLRPLAGALQILLLCSLANSAVLPVDHYTHVRDNNSYYERPLAGDEDHLWSMSSLLRESPYLTDIDQELGAEFLVELVVPQYLREFSDLVLQDDLFQEPSQGGGPTPIEMLFDGIDNENCKGHVLEFMIRAGRMFNDTRMLISPDNTWALQMLDSYGKIPEGILSGHVNVFGDFDECVEVKARDIEVVNPFPPKMTQMDFEGRYCTVYIADYGTSMDSTGKPIPARPSPSSSKSVGIRSSGGIQPRDSLTLMEFIALIADPLGTQIIPSIGICMPNSCSRGEIQQFLVNSMNLLYLNISGSIVLPPGTPPLPPLDPTLLPWPFTLACYEQKKPDFDAADISVMALLGAFAALCVLTGAVDYWLNHDVDKPEQRGTLYNYLMAFSIYTNIKAWKSTRRPPGDFECLHGLRFFSTAWIILAHTYFAVTFLPQWNMADVRKVHEDWTVITVLNSSFAVDTFFVIGGMLVSFNITKTLQRSNGKINIIMLYIKRYFRLTPTYAILVGIMATLIPYLGNGPYWAVMNNWGRVCEDNWWTNLIYVNNLVNTSNLCQGETWYLANDMQFYILSPFIVYPLWKWEMIGIILLSGYTILSWVGPALVVHFLDISPTLIPTRDSQVGKSFTHLYIRPYARISPYLVGIWLGWILYKTKGKKIKLHPMLVTALWLLSTAVALTVIFAIYPWFDPEEEIPKAASLAYAGLSRFAFGVVVAWIIFACVKGYGGIVNSFLSWKVFMPLARLCYCVYLVSLHLQMILHVGFTQPIKYDPYVQANFFLSHMVMSFLVGFVLWLLFEAPFLILQKLIFDGGPKPDNSNRKAKRPPKRYGIYYNDIETIMKGGGNDDGGVNNNTKVQVE